MAQQNTMPIVSCAMAQQNTMPIVSRATAQQNTMPIVSCATAQQNTMPIASCPMAQQNTTPIKAVLISCIVVPLFPGFFKTVTPGTVKVCSILEKMMAVKLKWKKSTRKLRHDRKDNIKTNWK
jgi:hypothetical protein